jgi:hypothetical protein
MDSEGIFDFSELDIILRYISRKDIKFNIFINTFWFEDNNL